MGKEYRLRNFGNNVKIFDGVKIVYSENISIGNESIIDDFCFLYANGKGIEIGNFCHITAYSFLSSGGLIRMDDFSTVGPRTTVLAATDDYEGNGLTGLSVFGSKYRNTKNEDVIIGRHALIGAGSIILPGVTIGDGCSVGAGSVVTKDLPEWTICYGSPCKPHRDKPKEKQLKMERDFLNEYYGGVKHE
jgi:acetyltransferase-like isoleucine patch superfamily enzyme